MTGSFLAEFGLNIGLTIASIDNAKINLNSLNISHYFGSMSSFKDIAWKHYSR